MNLREEITMYRDVRTSDGAGGYTTTRTEVAELFASVKPLSLRSAASLGLDFNQLKGTQIYEVAIRTDFNRIPGATYSLDWKSIYGTLTLVVNSIELGLKFTKLICTHETRITA